jgi:hypothetical protein
MNAQDKRGNTVIFGGGGIFARFSGDTSKPVTKELVPYSSNPNEQIWISSSSSVSDSTNGDLLFFSNGMMLYDSTGQIIENGDSLQPNKIYMVNCCPTLSANDQSVLILPKGSAGLYYIFTPTISDSLFDYWNSNPFGDGRFPFDILQYHVVDMNANGGMGKVTQKNVKLLENVELCKTGMMACKHANGYDWWLLKQGANTNSIYTFLVTKDAIILDAIQNFSTPIFGYYDRWSQSCFNNDGSKYAFASGGGFSNTNGAQLCIFDFDRCYGILSNPKVIPVPYDSTLTPLDAQWQSFDSLITGIAFSPNDSFLYINRRYNIYQYELKEPDSSLAWYHLQYGPDTTYQQFQEYNNLYVGVDKRIYISKIGGGGASNSYINKPNRKGNACDYCRYCLAVDSSTWYTKSFGNMPNYNMPKKEPCYPLDTPTIIISDDWEVYPNPSTWVIYIKNKKEKLKELYNVVGEKLLSTNKDEIDISSFSKGIYFIKCEGETKKAIVE